VKTKSPATFHLTHDDQAARPPPPRSGSVQPCSSANGGGPSQLPLVRLVAAVADLGSLVALNAMDPLAIPKEVTNWLSKIFVGCNERISLKLSNNPNLPEESLDLTWIEHLSQYSSPKTFSSAWTVRLDTHYLGGLRHFYGWEIADIGLLIFFRRAGKIIRSKVALLQSKRLYPSNNSVREEIDVDYQIGFARLADPEEMRISLTTVSEFSFADQSRYGALAAGSQQVREINDYQRKNKLSVYYQLYNPWTVPFTQRIPLTSYTAPDGALTLGTRVIPATVVHDSFRDKPKGYKPALVDFEASCGGDEHRFGWRLEFFVADLVLQCREGSPFQDISDERIQTLFYRRSGPISAAIAINIELPP